MKIGIYVNKNRDVKCETSLKFISLLKQKGIEYFVVSGAEDCISDKSYSVQQVADMCDVIVAFGGDGTMLSVVREAAKYNVAFLGVNLGRLGFLTECEDDNLENVVDRLAAGDYFIEERMMLNVLSEGKEYVALNEVTLSRSLRTHTVEVSIYVDNRLADIVTGDGAIISTPTGSTAYSMSCGGAILSPSVKAIGITAICPHSLHSRPIIVSDESELKLCAKTLDKHDAMMCIDGKNIEFGNNEINIIVKKSEYYAKLIRLNDNNFYNKLIQKMSGWNKLDKREI